MTELKQGSTLKDGKYKIVKVLGKGSFGITYLATTRISIDGQLGKMDVTVNVTIKEFFMTDLNSRAADGTNVEKTSSTLVKNYRTKFRKEAENLAKLHHSNIVKVLEVFDENNTTYYVMEYVDGETIDDYIKEKGRLSEDEALQITQKVCDALSYMHEHRMLHLDLKPKNIMRNAEEQIFLIDFGLAKQYTEDGEPESSTSIGLGTPGYAPIEQSNYKQDGTFPATLDIYALGATLYKMLTGITPPHASEILTDGFPDGLFAKLSVSAETTSMVKKAMNPIKKQRYQFVSELFGNSDDTIFDTPYENWIHSTLNDEHSYSKEFIERHGISIFSFATDGRFQIYYRGKIYNGDEINIYKFQSLANTASFLDEAKYHLKPNGSSIDFETYINSNKKNISTAYNIITYCSECDFLKIQRLIKKQPFAFGAYRIVREMDLIPLCFDLFKDAYYSYEYQHQYCETVLGGGVVEIWQSGFIDQKDVYTQETIVKKLSNFEGFAYLVLGAIIQYCIIKKKWQDDIVLLSVIPFDIKAEIWINGRYRDGIGLIERNTTIPCKKSDSINDDNCSVVIGLLGKRFSLDINNLFRYHPRSIQLTTDIDAGTNIKFILKDIDMKKEIFLSFRDLLSYEVKDTSEDTIWQN